MILYLHGFRSSSKSYKARSLGRYLDTLGDCSDYISPDLSPHPAEAISDLLRWHKGLSQKQASSLCIVGSSLGGFYAHGLAERWGCQAILLNPAVHADRDLQHLIGHHHFFYDETQSFELSQTDVDVLKRLKPQQVTRPDRYLLVACTGDEILNYQEMLDFYPDSPHYIIQGSDHGISDFDKHIDSIMQFTVNKQN